MAWLFKQYTDGKKNEKASQPYSQTMVVRHNTQVPAGTIRFSNPYLFAPDAVQQHMNRMMQQAFQSFEHMNNLMNFDEGWDNLIASPTMDMRELGDRYEVIFSLPGMQSADVTVVLEGRLLTVASNREGHDPLRRQYNRFESRVQIPGPVGDLNQARADFTNGVLKVTVPRGQGTGSPAGRVKLI